MGCSLECLQQCSKQLSNRVVQSNKFRFAAAAVWHRVAAGATMESVTRRPALEHVVARVVEVAVSGKAASSNTFSEELAVHPVALDPCLG